MAEQLADAEVGGVLEPCNPGQTVEGVVVGTILGGLLIAALRAMAHESTALRDAGAMPAENR